MNRRSIRACLAGLTACAVVGTLATAPAQAATGRATITSVSPDAGLPSGGARVVLHGTNFVHVTAVRFGTVSVVGKQFSVASAHRLVVIAPRHHADTIHVRVVTSAGTSVAHRADRFTYRQAPDPVSDLAVVDTSTASATLRWTPSSSANLGGVVIRRTDGSAAPDSPSSGTQVAIVSPAATHYFDTGLAPAKTYSYAAFAFTDAGPLYSAPASVEVTTPQDSGIAGITTNPPPLSGSVCSAPYPFIGRGELTLSAQIPGSGGTSPLEARFTVWDLGASGAKSPTYVLGPTDPHGVVTTGLPPSGGDAFLRVDGGSIVNGHLYGMEVVADDGDGYDASSAPCHFWYDGASPTTPSITSPDSTFHVGVKTRLKFATADVAPEAGRASGMDHFTYSFVSAGELGGAGTDVPAVVDSAGQATGSLKFTPTTWGTNYVYVAAVDAAGNESFAASYHFYVQDS